jgi:hypothetical protein
MLFFREANHESAPSWVPDGGEALGLSFAGICSLVLVGSGLGPPSSPFPLVEAADERPHRMVVRSEWRAG